MAGYIRPVARCLFKSPDGQILAQEVYDPTRDSYHYHPLGGGIEFGEHSQEAAIREVREEIGAEITNVRYLGMIENIFTYQEKMGHEIAMIYIADFVDPAFYDRPVIEVNENGEVMRAVWQPLSVFKEGRYPLYPTGLLELLEK